MNVTEICEARFPDRVQESAVDVQSIFSDGIAVALNTEVFADKNLGLSINGPEWKIYSSSIASGNLQPGVYHVRECTIDGVQFKLNSNVPIDKMFRSAMSRGRSIQFNATRVSVSERRKQNNQYQVRILRTTSPDQVTRTAEMITKFRYRFTWKLRDGRTVTKVVEGGSDFQAIRDEAEKHLAGIDELISVQPVK